MKLLHFLSSLALSAALSVSAGAQCFVPDNLDTGSACSGAQTNVPQRGFGQQALGICFKDCNVDATANYTAKWGPTIPVAQGLAPITPSCGWYTASLNLYAGNILVWKGTLHLSYSRTWIEMPLPGQQLQVWRFLVNGDLVAQNPTAFPCGTPACAPFFNNKVRFTGYVDYAHDCGTTLNEHAWMLTHACDSIDHAAGFPRSGVYHSNRYYSIVGPALGFVPGAGATMEMGPIGQECIRKWDALALPARCTTEEPLLFGNINPNTTTCMCGTGPSNWYEGQLQLAGGFGSTVTPFFGSDPFRSFPVGQWTNPLTFPGVEELRWNCNEAQWNPCTSASRQEYFFGVTTCGGFPAFTFNATTPPTLLPPNFIDQSNSVVLPANFATRNRPYRSDHIVNLNF